MIIHSNVLETEIVPKRITYNFTVDSKTVPDHSAPAATSHIRSAAESTISVAAESTISVAAESTTTAAAESTTTAAAKKYKETNFMTVNTKSKAVKQAKSLRISNSKETHFLENLKRRKNKCQKSKL